MEWIRKRAPLGHDQARDLILAYRVSLQAVLRGNGTEQAWSTLACSFHIALLLAEYGISANSIETIKLAQTALMRARERAERTGKWLFDGDGARVILATANIHDDQLDIATKDQIVKALVEVNRRVTEGEVFA
jgi:hypothetical protein